MHVKLKMFDQQREFNGILVEAQWLGVKNDYHSYRLVLRPWLWLLSPHDRLPDISGQESSGHHQGGVSRIAALPTYESKLTEEGSCPKLEYCVQYRETDLNFVSRLMEQHGIYYFFKHEGGKQRWCSPIPSRPIAGPRLASVPCIPLDRRDRRIEEHIY